MLKKQPRRIRNAEGKLVERTLTSVTAEHKEAITYKQRLPKMNFLKDLGIVMKWARKTYKLTSRQLEVLFHLYDEGLWSTADYYTYTLHRGCTRAYLMKEFLADEWVVVYREYDPIKRKGKLFTVSHKTKQMVSRIQKILIGEEDISVQRRHIPEAKTRNQTMKDKMYVKALKAMNKRRAEIRLENGEYEK